MIEKRRCPKCFRFLDDHTLRQLYDCLDGIAARENEDAARACGGATAAALDQARIS